MPKPHSHRTHCGVDFFENTIPPWDGLKGFSLPLLFQNSTSNTEAPVSEVEGAKTLVMHPSPYVGESYLCWDFTDNENCKIPVIREARVCDDTEFPLALSPYSQWKIMLKDSRNRHFSVLLIFYLKLNSRYRVINTIHPCLSHTINK